MVAILLPNNRLSMNIELSSMNTSTAQQAFDLLVEEESNTCLWFLRDVQSLSVESTTAETVLSAIIRHGSRDAWQKAKRLQTWRLLHTK